MVSCAMVLARRMEPWDRWPGAHVSQAGLAEDHDLLVPHGADCVCLDCRSSFLITNLNGHVRVGGSSWWHRARQRKNTRQDIIIMTKRLSEPFEVVNS